MKKLQKKLHHLFVPHTGNNHRSKLLHHTSLLIILFALLALIGLSNFIKTSSPGVLGISYSITQNDLLQKTNEARAQNGLPPLTLNTQLAQAASGKAQHMFTNNYWSHFAPDGTTPWHFIKGSGYEYIYAGENLAKGFTQSDQIVQAWLASPTHRENILSPKYDEIGFAVMEGSLLGEETVLVVQMFGANSQALAQAPAEVAPQETVPEEKIATQESTSQVEEVQEPTQQQPATPDAAQEVVELPINNIVESPTLNAGFISQSLTLTIVSLILFVLLIDLVVVGKKRIPRVVGNNIDHILLISIFIILIVVQNRGGIL